MSDPLPPFSQDQRDAFDELKRRLTSAPILDLPRSSGAYVQDTDPSYYQVGCVVRQEQPEKTHKPAGYYCRPITEAEKNYSMTGTECLAVVWALFMLRPYVQGTRLIVRTYHSALRWMLHMDGAHGRLARWRLRLSEIDSLDVTRAGAAYHSTDTMFRLATTALDTMPFPEEIPCLTLANSSRAWTMPSYEDKREYPPVTVDRLVKVLAQDNLCHELRQEMDRDAHYRYSENAQGFLSRRAPPERATQLYVPKSQRTEIVTLAHAPTHAGHPGANKMYVSMRLFFYWESMVADVYDNMANCGTCAKGRAGGRRRTNPLRLFLPTEPLSAVCLDLFGPLPKTAMGNRYLFVMADCFSKLTRVVALPRKGAETGASAFCDTWVAFYGPPDTVLTANGPQLTSTLFQGVCRLMGITNLHSKTYHRQTQGQAERYIITIVSQLKAYVEDHENTWDELVSVLTLAYNLRPQKSTGVAPIEFVVPKWVRKLALGRLPKDPYPQTVPRTALEAREHQQDHLRNLITQVRATFATAQRRHKRNFVKRVRQVNKALKVCDWVFVDGHDTE